MRLVRLNDTTPPSMPIVAQPAYIAASKAVSLSWVPSSDNIQIDHYQILRNGVPLSATDATTFTDTDTARLQATSPSYVVRAVDTNGNITDSDAKTVKVPDWTPPTQPVPTLEGERHDRDADLARGCRQHRRRRLRRPARRHSRWRA